MNLHSMFYYSADSVKFDLMITEYILHGIFEAFPVSSSMHSMLFNYAMQNSYVMQNIGIIGILHGITAIVTIVYFHKSIIKLLIDFIKPGHYNFLSWKLCLILLPKLLFGFIYRNANFPFSFYTIIAFGLLLAFYDIYSHQNKKAHEISYMQSIFISFLSLFAFLPGASSLGTYYTAFRACNINRKESLDYAFILNVIPSIGAFVLRFTYVEVNLVRIFTCMFVYLFALILCRKLINYLYLLGIYRVIIGIWVCQNINIQKYFYCAF
ncbi:undecaprenyl-diphosphate phosphatase [Candidatus Cytomitobacter primus]|nr:undecaprenyl-diphosphate phosphatase [Candidatus Cytomitobacter primus]